MHMPRNIRGFTLIELMITLVILVIASSLAVPAATQMINSNHAESHADELTKMLRFARSQAVSSQRSYTISIDNDDKWTAGAGSDIERVFETATKITINTNPDLSTDDLVFNTNGVASSATDFIICYKNDASNGYLIEVSATGLIRRHARGQDKDGTALGGCTP